MIRGQMFLPPDYHLSDDTYRTEENEIDQKQHDSHADGEGDECFSRLNGRHIRPQSDDDDR